jgi:hypothetical protein
MSGTASSHSQVSVADLNVLGGLVTAKEVVESTASTMPNRGQAAMTQSQKLLGLVVAGQPVLGASPNLAISAPG